MTSPVNLPTNGSTQPEILEEALANVIARNAGASVPIVATASNPDPTVWVGYQRPPTTARGVTVKTATPNATGSGSVKTPSHRY